MKLKVIGWINDTDYRFEDADASFAVLAAIEDDIRKNKWMFTGWDHQERDNGVPVLNNGKAYRFSQRGWGGVMADAYGCEGSFDYARFAFNYGAIEDFKMPKDDDSMVGKIYDWAEELLTKEERDFLFEEDFTTRFPHKELGDKEIYTLTEKEREYSCFEIVRQIPNCIYKKLVEDDLQETFILDAKICEIKDDRIVLPLCSALRYIDKGDTVIVGDKTFTVKDVDQKKDVSEEVWMKVMFGSQDKKREEAEEIYKKAGYILHIMI